MGTVVVRRRPRRPAPEVPAGELAVQAPPETAPETGSRWSTALAAVPMLTGTVATALLFAGHQGGLYTYVVGGVFGLSSLGMLATSLGGAGGGRKKAETAAARREYLRYLAGLRRQVRATTDEQRAALHYRHPDPATLWSTVDSFRLWERRPGDADFAVVRLGLGPQTLATPLVPPVTRPPQELEPTTAGALRRFLDTYSVVADLPVALSVRGFSRLYLHGAQGATRALVRAMIASLSVLHAPADLMIAVCAAPERRPDWEYLKWLPHAQHPVRTDALGPVRLITGTVPELEGLLEEVLANRPRFGTGTPPAVPQLVVVLDGADTGGARHLSSDGGVAGVLLVDLDAAAPPLLDRGTLALSVAADATLTGTAAAEAGGPAGTGPEHLGVADQLALAAAQALARQLAPLRLAAAVRDADAAAHTEVDLADLLGIGDPGGFDVARAWAPRPARDTLRVPVGTGADGHPVELDLKESAQDGMGPHGLLIGATGSGKSELLRTLVLGLAATHDSETLNLVLIDFKGGATFASLDRLPHTAAVITNLADELPLVDRMTDALNGELVRRQELLRRSGNLASLRDYEKARLGGAPLAPLPVLLVICDEFSELLARKPEFIDLFLQIGRLGRSLGVHLLLASQRLEEGRLRGLDTHLSYRIGLRTFSALESRTVLGVPDAYELPRSPGHGYLRYGTEPLVRFRAGYASGPYRRPGPGAGTVAGTAAKVQAYTSHPVPVPEPVPAPPGGAATGPGAAAGPGGTGPGTADPPVPSLLELMVGRLAGAGTPAHQVWLPPLGRPATLDELLGPATADPARGLCVANTALYGALAAPVALVDKPFEQRRDLLWLTLDGAAGHVAVVGGPRSGKSTTLRTLVTGLALTHTPREAQFYCLDFGGGALAALRDLPHVGGVASRQDTAAVRRTVGDLAALLAGRERYFAGHGVDSMASYRRRGYPGDPYGDVFLLVDGWATLRGEYDDLEPVLTDLATRGLSYGLHLIGTATRWTDFRPGVRDLFGSRVELRLGDPADSLVSRRDAANVPERVPGRGITAEGTHLLTALPALAGQEPADLAKAVAAGWTGPRAPAVRLLPAEVPYDDLAVAGTPDRPLQLPVGLAEADLGAVALDFAADPHLLVFGDSGSGRSSFLRALATTITRRFSPEQARLIIVDHRRGLLGAVGTEHLIGYGSTGTGSADLVESVAGYMARRLPGAEVTPAQLRDRSWWQGPECFLLVDDYDLVAGTGAANPLLPLLEYLPQARDIGLHLVLARRTGGAARALFEPVVQRLRELSTPGLLLSGDRDEGPLLGSVRPQPLPPGRAWLVTRTGGARLVQLAHLPPT